MDPFFYDFFCIFPFESAGGQKEDLARSVAEPEEIVQEEIVQLVRAYQVLRLLADVSLFLSLIHISEPTRH